MGMTKSKLFDCSHELTDDLQIRLFDAKSNMWWDGIEPGGQSELDGGGGMTGWSPERAPASTNYGGGRWSTVTACYGELYDAIKWSEDAQDGPDVEATLDGADCGQRRTHGRRFR
jgi:hypothetical protein